MKQKSKSYRPRTRRHLAVEKFYPLNLGIPIRKLFGSQKRFLRNLIMERDGIFCAICFWPLTLEEATIDHILPLGKGGTDRFNNLQIACDKCNSKKGDKYEPDFESCIY